MENQAEIMHHVLKMQYILLLPKYGNLISMDDIDLHKGYKLFAKLVCVRPLFSHNVTSTLAYANKVQLLTLTILLSFADVMIPAVMSEILTSVANTYLFPKRYDYPKSL